MKKRFRLKETHPTAVKLQRLIDYAEELGLSLTFAGHVVTVRDAEREDLLVRVEDVENKTWFESFPFPTDYKLVTEYNTPTTQPMNSSS